MKKLLLILTLFIAILFIDSKQVLATHLMGGSLTYEYLGQVAPPAYRYRITFTAYQNCNSPWWGTSFPESWLNLGIYEGTASPSSDPTHVTTISLPLIDSSRIKPDLPDTCTIGTNICVFQLTYTTVVDLPMSFQGYHLFYNRCCRNDAIVNLATPPAGNQGMAFHAFIPPSLVVNSSPVFTDIAIPYLCAGDTMTFPNSAIDPDGDVLEYSFVHPFWGPNSASFPNPGPPTPNLSWPIDLVNYKSGYSRSVPFGASGFALINSISGITAYYSPLISNYVVAVEIKEYRNGQIVGLTRRDLQLMVISCPPNPPPNLSGPSGPGITEFSVREGGNLCFPVTFYDQYGDSLFLTSTGGLFDSSIVNPSATLADTIGDSIVNTQFCWNTACGQAKDSAYIFIVVVRDNGCPSKIAYKDFKVYVNEYIPPDTIFGPDTSCALSTDETYYVFDSIGGTHQWQIVGGVQSSGDSSTSITIDWNDTTNGSITVMSTSPEGCPGDTITLNIILTPLPNPYAGKDTSFCSGDTVTIGNDPILGYSYVWDPGIGLDDSTLAKPTITMTNDSTFPDTIQYIRSATSGNCTLDDTVMVIIYPLPMVDSIYGSPYVCPGITGVDYYVFGTAVSSYNWMVVNGSISSGQGTDSIKVDWSSTTGVGKVSLIETTSGVCIGDTLHYSVRINPILTPVKPIGPDSLCEKLITSIDYEAIYTNNSTYNWSILGGAIISGQGSYKITVDWDTLGMNSGVLFYEETSTTIDTFCLGSSDTLFVSIFSTPSTSLITGEISVCEFDSGLIYSVTGDSASKYHWEADGGFIDGSDSTPTITVNWGSNGTYRLFVVETSWFGCISDTVDTMIVINPSPGITKINGSIVLCAPNNSNKLYYGDGYSNSTYQWFVNGGAIISGGTGDSIVVNWNNTGNGYVKVIETTTAGCVSDSVAIAITLDNPLISIDAVSDNYTNDKNIEINWTLLNGQNFNGDYFLSRKKNSIIFDWDSIATVQNNYYKDMSLPTSSYSFDYKVQLTNACFDTISSSPHNSILLSGKGNIHKNIVALEWNEYKNWPSGVKRYEIWRKIDNETSYTYYASGGQNASISFDNAKNGFTHCYKLRAVENTGPHHSWSNHICIVFEHLIIIPSAFTPNGDGVNETWFIENIDMYPNCTLEVYNRWGNMVYSSSRGYGNDWTGERNGTPLPDGTYYYVFNLNNNLNLSKNTYTGPVTIIR